MLSIFSKPRLAYLITVSQHHLLPCRMLLATLTRKTSNSIYVVGNLTSEQKNTLSEWPIEYIDENDIDFSHRLPAFRWETKFRERGWYKQMFVRLCADRFINAGQVVILDSEVFVFENWDERRFYAASGEPKCFFWIPATRKPDWDYRMYRGAAFLYRDMPEFAGVMEYANSDGFRRHISGVVLFSTEKLRSIWKALSERTDLAANIDRLFNHEPELAFSDHDFYGIAIDYGFCNDAAPTVLSNELLGWYDNHNDPSFDVFREQYPMWSMCQRYREYPSESDYLAYMHHTTSLLHQRLPVLNRNTFPRNCPAGDKPRSEHL